MRSYSVGILAALVLLVPGAVAGFTPDSDVRNYITHVYEADSTADGGVVTASFEFTVPHDLTVVDRESWFRIDINYLLEGSGLGATRVREFTFQSDGGAECTWRVSIGSNLQALNAYRALDCINGPVEPGTHTFWINATQISGSNPVTWSQYSITLTQREVVTMASTFEAHTGLTAVEFLIFPALAVLGLYLWTRRDFGVRLFGITLVLFDLALAFGFYATSSGDAWEGLLVFVFALLLAVAWMVVQLASDQLRGRREGT